jgi:hypothetical protein
MFFRNRQSKAGCEEVAFFSLPAPIFSKMAAVPLKTAQPKAAVSAKNKIINLLYHDPGLVVPVKGDNSFI